MRTNPYLDFNFTHAKLTQLNKIRNWDTKWWCHFSLPLKKKQVPNRLVKCQLMKHILTINGK